MKDKGKATKFKDYLGNVVHIGDMVVFTPYKAGRQVEFLTGTVLRETGVKLRVKVLGRTGWNSEEWAYATTMINIKNLAEKE